ncbi:hypothetical protein HY933_03355 [Candidatus Falkowbacteria bacterium]|nr:hypothetical protein [Candidatus Falkowbacteria bacterium]
MYTDKPVLTIEDARQMWLGFGLDPALADTVCAKSYQLLEDDATVKKIATMYDLMLDYAKNFLAAS